MEDVERRRGLLGLVEARALGAEVPRQPAEHEDERRAISGERRRTIERERGDARAEVGVELPPRMPARKAPEGELGELEGAREAPFGRRRLSVPDEALRHARERRGRDVDHAPRDELAEDGLVDREPTREARAELRFARGHLHGATAEYEDAVLERA